MTTPDAGQRLIEDLRLFGQHELLVQIDGPDGQSNAGLHDAAADEIERLRGVEADARRYRAIRDEINGVGGWVLSIFAENCEGAGEILTGSKADDAIDAAIEYAASRSTGAADVGEDQ